MRGRGLGPRLAEEHSIARLNGALDVAHGPGGAGFTGGTGLAGLKDRVEALGGRIFLDSPPGAGTSLRVELPLTATNSGASPSPGKWRR